MSLIVQKYGGSSLATPESIKRIAGRVVEEHRRGHRLVVVVSAMGDTTDHLEALARQVSDSPPEREMDMLLSVGERISIALLAMAISDLGCEAISFTGSQVGIITDNRHTEARILEVRGLRIREALDSGKIVIVAGFQGVSIDKEITTLGRGGSDTTALALAAALQADRCEIMKDVDGVYVAEPRLVADPRLNPQISYGEMIEMAGLGAGVLKTDSVETARRYHIRLGVGSSATGKVGTIITDEPHQSAEISGIVGRKGLVACVVSVGSRAAALALLAELSARRSHAQNLCRQGDQISFLLEKRGEAALRKWIAGRPPEEGLKLAQVTGGAGLIGVVGCGLNFNSPAAQKLFAALQSLQVETPMLQVSELRISWMTPAETVDSTVQALYREIFGPQHPSAKTAGK